MFVLLGFICSSPTVLLLHTWNLGACFPHKLYACFQSSRWIFERVLWELAKEWMFYRRCFWLVLRLIESCSSTSKLVLWFLRTLDQGCVYSDLNSQLFLWKIENHPTPVNTKYMIRSHLSFEVWMKQVEGNGKSTWTQLENYMEGAINQLASLNFEGKKH